jgi:uncharacterized protein (DUF58 family)
MTGRPIRLTRRGWTVVGAAVGLLGAGRLLGALELDVLGVAALAAVGAAAVAVALVRPGLTVTRRVHPVRLHVGDAARVDLLVRADRAVPAFDLDDRIDGGRLRAGFVGAPLAAGAIAEPAYRLPTDRRGAIDLGPARLECSDPLGLVVRHRVVAAVEPVLVRPRVHRVAPPGPGAGDHHAATDGTAVRTAADDDAGEFLAVRPYETGDDPRRVHWRSSARADDLMVRQFAAPRLGTTLLVLDTRAGGPDPGGPAFEHAVEAVASLAVALGRARRPFACTTTAGTVLTERTTDPNRLLDRLATVTDDEPDRLTLARPGRRTGAAGPLVVVSARGDAALVGLRRRGGSVTLVVTGGDVPRAPDAGGPVVDARTVAFPEAWRARHAGPRTRAQARR